MGVRPAHPPYSGVAAMENIVETLVAKILMKS